MVFPVIQFLKRGKKRVSDIEYLCTIASGSGPGNATLVKNEGFKSAAGDLATLTAASAKDLYIVRAKCIIYANTNATFSDASNSVVLLVNGSVVETASTSLGTQSNAFTSQPGWEYEFKNIGYKVDATEIIKLEVITLGTSSDVEGFIQCIQIDDGVVPQL